MVSTGSMDWVVIPYSASFWDQAFRCPRLGVDDDMGAVAVQAGLGDAFQLGQPLDRIQQGSGCQVPGGALQIGRFERQGSIVRQQLAPVHKANPVAVLGFIHVMSGDENGRPLRGELVNQVPELTPRHRVDAAGRLIQEQERRLVDQGAAQRQALAPPAGKVCDRRH